MVAATVGRLDGGKNIFFHVFNRGLKLHPAVLRDDFQDLVHGEETPFGDALHGGLPLRSGILLAGGHILRRNHP